MEDSNSWLRRSKYSYTVCHRFDTSKLATYLSEASRLIPRSLAKSDFAPPRVYSPIQVNPVTSLLNSASSQIYGVGSVLVLVSAEAMELGQIARIGTLFFCISSFFSSPPPISPS
ncbi:hypothetical protein LINPERHAP1_LOCUS18372 [Linum perenne]